VDVAITIPSKLLKSNHISDHKYFAIRAAYLLSIAQYLKGFKMFEDIQIHPFKQDFFKPILVITPKKGKFPLFFYFCCQYY
jgi:hypothetical protein